MRHTAFFVLGLGLLLVQENFFRVLDALSALLRVLHVPGHPLQTPGLTPSLVVPLLIFLGTRDVPFLAGAALSFVFGYASDVLGIVPVGLYTFSMVSIFLLARALGLRLATQTKLPQMLVTAGFCLAKSGIVLVCLGIFAKDGWVARSVYPYALPHVLSTALCAPLVFLLAERVHAATAAPTLAKPRGGLA